MATITADPGLRYRVLAAVFEYLFAFPLYSLALAAWASFHTAPVDPARQSLAASGLAIAIIVYHSFIARQVSLRSPGERIVGFDESKKVVNPFDRSRWMLFTGITLMLVFVAQKASFNPRDLLSVAPDVLHVVSSIPFVVAPLYSAIRISEGDLRWSWFFFLAFGMQALGAIPVAAVWAIAINASGFLLMLAIYTQYRANDDEDLDARSA